MLTSSGCEVRRKRLFDRVTHVEWIVISDPSSLVYFANFCPSPFVFNSQGAAALLLLGRDGSAVLVADNAQEPFAKSAHVTEAIAPVWYRCVESAGHRRSLLVETTAKQLLARGVQDIGYEAASCPAGLIESLAVGGRRPALVNVDPVVRELRVRKDADEVTALRRAIRAAEAGFAAGLADIWPGMTELDAYRIVCDAAQRQAGCQVLVYGDFVSGPRCEQVGGPPSSRMIEPGDLVLLDFSVVIDGYRGDFANTFVCGGRATARQREMVEACVDAMRAGEATLRAGVPAKDVHQAVRGCFASRQLDKHFPHHTGHGVGLGHPETPFLVPESSDTLAVGNVLTIEPGLYVPGVGGMRYERNYLITETDFETLTHHQITIDQP
ncbi:MAG: aminopeptidase P family protein [Planctomycetales bacterium]|nr:aminopeptidase P family protein [Planctomycetales bacterium]